MGGDQFDRRWYILGGFAVLAIVIVGIIVISRGGGGSGEETTTTASKASNAKGSVETAAEQKESISCTKVAQPKPREESLPKPKMTTKKGEKVIVDVETNCGSFEIELATTEAPITSNSFAYLVEEGFYDELTFHRIVPEFVIQGGDPTATGTGGAGYSVTEAPPQNLKYKEGVVAMAKSSADPPGRSSSQFYVVSGPQGESLPAEYALAGRVTKGMNVVHAIGELGGPEEKPTEPVVIEKMSLERG